MNRNNAIDISKGIGIFLVIWAHTICPFRAQIYVFHMPLFFLVSGFLFNNRDTVKTTVIKKIRSLLIPFVFFVILQRVGFILVYLIGGTFKSSYLLLWNPVPVRGVLGVLWFILALFLVTIIYSLINRLRSYFLIFLASFLASLAGYLLYRYKISLPMHIDASLSMMLFFFVGNFLARTDTERVGPVRNWALLSAASVIIFIVVTKYYLPDINIVNNVIEGNFLLSTGLILLGCLMVLINSKLLNYVPIINNALAYLGRNSLTIYATHTFILEAVYLVYPRESVTTWGGVIISLLILGLCLLLNIGLQKYFPFVFGKKDILAGIFKPREIKVKG